LNCPFNACLSLIPILCGIVCTFLSFDVMLQCVCVRSSPLSIIYLSPSSSSASSGSSRRHRYILRFWSSLSIFSSLSLFLSL
jgi:hypothetical protein